MYKLLTAIARVLHSLASVVSTRAHEIDTYVEDRTVVELFYVDQQSYRGTSVEIRKRIHTDYTQDQLNYMAQQGLIGYREPKSRAQ